MFGVAGSAIVLLRSLAWHCAMCQAICFVPHFVAHFVWWGHFDYVVLCTAVVGGKKETMNDAAAMVSAKRQPWLVEKRKL